ncbi:hypothetical protein T01_3691 [Trichinella spiralis]|uniref:Uncharacterized protein n=1 Tax=Trichinella spiralis TaxID=6334 RepID=A0A0V1B7E8_TRISP|nr:hypothetical protein T01_3691 [Trichinella spiralis]
MDDSCAMSDEQPSLLIGDSLSLPLILFVETDAKQRRLLIKSLKKLFKSIYCEIVFLNSYDNVNFAIMGASIYIIHRMTLKPTETVNASIYVCSQLMGKGSVKELFKNQFRTNDSMSLGTKAFSFPVIDLVGNKFSFLEI